MPVPLGLPGRWLPPPEDAIDLSRRATITTTVSVGSGVTAWTQITATLTDPFITTAVVHSQITAAEIGYGPSATNVTPVLPLPTDVSSVIVPAWALGCVLPAGVNHLWLRTQSDANTKQLTALHGFYAPGARTLDRQILHQSGSGLWLARDGSPWVTYRDAWIIGFVDAGSTSTSTITQTSNGVTTSTLLSMPSVGSWASAARGQVVPIKPVFVPVGCGLGYTGTGFTQLVVSSDPGAWSPVQIQGGLP